MPPRLTMDQMIAAFGSTYRTIDLRTVALKQGSISTSVYTVVRFSYEEPEDAKKRLLALESRYGVISTRSFQIRLESRPFSEWRQLSEELAKREHIGEIGFSPPVWLNLTRTASFLTEDYSAIRPFDSRLWPVAQFAINSHDGLAFAPGPVVAETTKIGYPDPYDAVNLLCELNVHFNQSQGCHFYLSAPLFAMASRLRISPKEERIHVEVLRDEALGSLECQVLVRQEGRQRSEPWKYRQKVSAKVANAEGRLVTVFGSTPLPDVKDDDSVEVQILHPEIGDLQRKSDSVRRLIPSVQRNLLFSAMRFFCDESEFSKLVIRPFDEKPPRMKVSASFELRVAWLLGLLGLSTVLLGEYEDIIAPKTGVKRGSIDILASSQSDGELFVVACTIGPPKDEDFNNLHTSAEILNREVFKDAAVKIMSLVCTCAPGFPDQGGNGIAVLDSDRLALAFELIKAGREREVLAFIENPEFSEIRVVEP